MQAMVLAEPGELEVQTLDAPVAGKGEIVIEVAACGVCRTDLQIFKGDIPLRKAPLILGHQIVGRIAGTGERVGLAWLWGACGHCKSCLGGRENLCVLAEFTGWTADGGYAERVVAREDFVYPLPEGVSDTELAPLLCAGIIGYRALRLSGIMPGGLLGLFGFGSSGHLAIQVARHWGCEVAVFCHLDRERELAAELGATWVGGYDDAAAGSAGRGRHVRAGRLGGGLRAAGDRPGRHRRRPRDPPRSRSRVLVRPPVARAHTAIGCELHTCRRPGVSRSGRRDPDPARDHRVRSHGCRGCPADAGRGQIRGSAVLRIPPP